MSKKSKKHYKEETSAEQPAPAASEYCPSCGTSLPDDWNFCPECGAYHTANDADNQAEQSTLPEGHTEQQPALSGKCSICGTQLPSGCDFCPICGTALPAANDSTQTDDDGKLDNDTAGQSLPCCPSCGAEIPEDCLFCKQCGSSLEDSGSSSQDNTEDQSALSDSSISASSDFVPESQFIVSENDSGQGYGTISSEQMGTADYCTCCGKVVTVNCTYCPVCGVRLQHASENSTADSSGLPHSGAQEIAELTLCEYCGLAIPFGALACSGCGASLYGGAGAKEARRCSCCGGVVAKTCMYCPVCGESLSAKNSVKKKAFAAGLPEWNLEPQFAAHNVRLPKNRKR